MPIHYSVEQRIFTLSGGDVSYVLHVNDQNHLQNIYWGKRIPDGEIRAELEAYPGGASFEPQVAYLPYELPVCGSGWYGTPAVSVRNAAGDNLAEFCVVDSHIYEGKKQLEGLPCTYTESVKEASSLEIELKDPLTGLHLTAGYTVYHTSGVITRNVRVENKGEQVIFLTSLLSASIPLFGKDYDLMHLKGAWAREREIIRYPLGDGEVRIGSQRGASSHDENPFLALCDKAATEHTGSVYAVNLVYSGSFLACASVDNMDNSRLSIGLNPDTFTWKLEPEECFQSPESVLVYSDQGFNGMSHQFHQLYRTRLIRGTWRDKDRPILINNWEATYFNFTQGKLLSIAAQARDIGVELFVLDDGWFGKRDSDDCSLGDWTTNPRKLPEGLAGLSRKIHEMGLQFGIWMEPEMVSPDSDLYREHPDWCLHVPGRSRTEARNQLILDLSREEVQDYIIKAVSDVLSSASIEYLKWDMNRNMMEAFSEERTPDRQMETQHRYILGLYRILETIVTRFPEVLFESCSGGGGRFDPGMLYYMPQTWTSDNTDAIARLSIQYGTSMAYPSSTMGAHISAVPNHQCLRVTSLKMRGDVALGGNFGFELDLTKSTPEELESCREIIQREKKLRTLVRTGTFSRILSPAEGKYAAWQFTSPDQSETLVCVYRILAIANTPPIRVRLTDICPEDRYEDDEGNLWSGSVLRNRGLLISLEGDFTSRIIHLRRQ